MNIHKLVKVLERGPAVWPIPFVFSLHVRQSG